MKTTAFRQSILVIPLAIIALFLVSGHLTPDGSETFRAIVRAHAGDPAHADASPLPNYRGHFVSMSGIGQWRRPTNVIHFVRATTVGETPPTANCSNDAVVYYATRAPKDFKKKQKGLLYGVRTHTAATRVRDMPGYNSCALVVYAILKRAGCRWVKRTANARSMYDMAYKHGWRPTETQRAGCLVAWNSRFDGKLPRIGRGTHRDPARKSGVLYRHLGITTGAWMAVDNTSVLSEPTAYITSRPIRYETPLFLCPAEQRQTKLK